MASRPLWGSEIEEIRRAMSGIGCRGEVVREGHEALVGAWRRFVRRCETGYVGRREDFLQDLSVRTMIERLLARLPRTIRRKIEDPVMELDQRYRSIPRQDEEFLLDGRLRHAHPYPARFWLYGLPAGSRLT